MHQLSSGKVRRFLLSQWFSLPLLWDLSNFIGQAGGEAGEGFMDVDRLAATGCCGMVCWLHRHWLWPLVPTDLVWNTGGVQPWCPSQTALVHRCVACRVACRHSARHPVPQCPGVGDPVKTVLSSVPPPAGWSMAVLCSLLDLQTRLFPHHFLRSDWKP